MFDLSIVVPGIRTEKWPAFCKSVFKTRNVSIEIIFVGPVDLPELRSDDRVKFIQDRGSPTRCSQIGVLHSTGRRIMFACDDALMIHRGQESIWGMMEGDCKTVILGKYTEGSGEGRIGRKRWRKNLADTYYKINSHELSASPYIPKDWIIGNFAYVDRSYFIKLGGFDCRFEAPAIPTTDFAIRAQRDGAKFVLNDIKIFELEFEGERGGTHSPIFDAFMENDAPLYRSIYDDPDCVNRMRIDFDNWKDAPEIWPRRIIK